MPKRRVLYVCHNHSSVFQGGVETYTSELYDAMRGSATIEPFLLARIGTAGNYAHAGTPFRPINSDPNQYFFQTSGFDRLYLTIQDKDVYSRHFHEFLLAVRPDVVHFQHALHLGYDLILQTRHTLPQAAIIMTLQEYVPICHNVGQMVRTTDGELCHGASPQRCNACFPEIAPQVFFMRKRFVQSFLTLVDVFLAPSRVLLERYVEWGIPRERIRYEEYGRSRVSAMAETGGTRVRNRVGYFGQFNPFKGLGVLFEAMRVLADDPHASETGVHLWVHGANLELHGAEFQDEFRSLVESSRGNVTLAGAFDRAELPGLMANVDWVVVPSIWWENSPLVIQEAFLCGRPVICTGIGGMAEKVAHGVNGLHFRRGDPASLAEAIRMAARSPGLWEKLRAGIPEVYKMDDHIAVLTELYGETLGRRHGERVASCQ